MGPLKDDMTACFHLFNEDQNRHIIGLNSLHVIVGLEPDGELWYAQGVEIDYAASGYSLEDVQNRFERGFTETIKLHLQRWGNLDRFLKYAPQSAIDQLPAPGKHYTMAVLAEHEFPKSTGLPLFANIKYLECKAA